MGYTEHTSASYSFIAILGLLDGGHGFLHICNQLGVVKNAFQTHVEKMLQLMKNKRYIGRHRDRTGTVPNMSFSRATEFAFLASRYHMELGNVHHEGAGPSATSIPGTLILSYEHLALKG